MTNTEPTSTDSTIERAENAESQPALVAVSEENLAALLRATSAVGEPEAQHPAVAQADEAATSVTQTNDAIKDATNVAQAAVEPAGNPPAAPVDSRLALFAAVKEHRSEILRAAAKPAPAESKPAGVEQAGVEQQEYPAANLPQTAPIQATLPKTQPKSQPTSQPTSQPVIPSAPPSTPESSRKLLVGGGVAGALILAVGIFLLWPKGHAPKAPAAVVAAKDNIPLQVLAEPLGNGLINVRWNAQSPLISQAREGRLVITEREKAPRIMELGAEQLKIGHLTYQSAAESIEFDLEVTDRSGGVVKESILALSSPAGAAAQAPRVQPAPVTPQVVSQAAAPPKVPTPAPPPVQAAAEVPQASPAKARTFVPPPTQRKNEQGAIIDAPPVLANAPVTPLGVSLPVSLAPISPPPAGAPQQIRVESNLQSANLIKRVVPVYPALARAAGIQGTVRFTALIGKDGKIRNLKTVSGPTPLVEAASSAVQQWVYRPTLLNGQPVEVITEINVSFNINGAR